MGFTEYGEMEYGQGALAQAALAAGLGGVECVCAVKVDGANFQAGVSPDGSFFTGSRRRALGPKDEFCGWQRVMQRYGAEEKVRAVARRLGAREAIMYGELCGGLYRHPGVPRVEGAVRVQGRVDYSPDNEWVPFDLMADGRFVGPDELAELCAWAGLPSQQIVFRGPLEECLRFDPNFQDTTGHDLWGLPLIGGNAAEGVVVKPVRDVRLGGRRLVFKLKAPKFKERIRATKAALAEAGAGLTPLEQRWAARLLEFACDARAWSALSKVGPEAGFAAVLREAVRDAEAGFRASAAGEAFRAEEGRADPKELRWGRLEAALSRALAPCVRRALFGG